MNQYISGKDGIGQNITKNVMNQKFWTAHSDQHQIHHMILANKTVLLI